MPGTFIAYLDVAALERRFPLFPDGSDGIFEHAAPLTGFFQSLFGTGPDTPDSGFTDGSDGSFYPTRTRERKTLMKMRMMFFTTIIILYGDRM